MAEAYPAPPGKDQPQVRTRLTTLTLAALLTLPAWAALALVDLGPGSAHPLHSAAPGSGSGGSGSEGSGSGSGGSGSGSGEAGSDNGGPGSAESGSGSGRAGSGSGAGRSGSGSGESGSGPGGPGSDDSRSATMTSPHRSNSSQHSASRSGLHAGPEPASQANTSAAEPAPPATSAAEPTTRAPSSAAESAPPVASVADRREGPPRLSTPPGLTVVAGVAGGALVLVAMVAAAFRARARLGKLG
jgi:hypothetical protein